MTITSKELDSSGNVYSVEDRGDGTVIKVKVDPILTYTPPTDAITLGDTVDVMFQLKDFDGETRTDHREITFIIDGTEIVETLTSGAVMLSIDCQARGRFTISIAPVEIAMIPLDIEVE